MREPYTEGSFSRRVLEVSAQSVGKGDYIANMLLLLVSGTADALGRIEAMERREEQRESYEAEQREYRG